MDRNNYRSMQLAWEYLKPATDGMIQPVRPARDCLLTGAFGIEYVPTDAVLEGNLVNLGAYAEVVIE